MRNTYSKNILKLLIINMILYKTDSIKGSSLCKQHFLLTISLFMKHYIKKRDILHVNWLAGLLPSTASGESEIPKLLASNSLSAFLAR